MKYLLLALLLIAFTGLEFFSVLAGAETPEALACLAPQTQADQMREALLLHLRGH